jgi:Putative quorum-sensing-regulated virulence factor
MQSNLSNSRNQTCPHCDSTNLMTHEREFSNGTHHIELRCINGHYIKFLSQNKPLVTMPFGKHKGAPIRELPDTYLNWTLENLHLKGRLFRALSEEYERRGGAV